MIRKIKKYKITIHPHGVLKLLKKNPDSGSNGEELEKKVRDEIARVQSLIVPSAIYSSYSKSETPAALQSVWQSASAQALSLSFLLVSVGSALEKEIEKRKAETNPAGAALLESIGQESLEQSLHFVTKLLSEEAKSESCELSPVCPVERSLWSSLLPFLESPKADILLDESGQMVPLYTSASYCFWNPLPKGRNAR